MNEYLFGLFSFIGMVATFTCVVLGLFKAMDWWLGEGSITMNRDHQKVPDLMKALKESMQPMKDSTPPATPVESPDENWFQRQARLAARDVQLLPPWLRSHPPAVSGEGERLKDAAEAFRAIALDALACWQGEDETQDDKHKRTRSAQARTLLRHRLHSANGMLRASTPTPGAPR